MKRHLLGYLRHTLLFSGVALCALLSASPAYSASFSYSSSVATANSTYLGGPGFYLPYSATNSSAAVPTSLTTINLGSFTTLPSSSAPNGNVVTSTFTFTFNTGLPTVASPVTFTGTVAQDPHNSSEYDITFSSTPTRTYLDGTANFDVQTVGTCDASLVGCYTIGLEPIQVNSSGKATNIWAFIGPSNLTTPEPSSTATMGFATIGLLLFAARRKFQAQRS